MRKIVRFEIPSTSARTRIELPRDAQVRGLCTHPDTARVFLLAETTAAAPTVPTDVWVVPATGNNVPDDGEFVGLLFMGTHPAACYVARAEVEQNAAA